MASIVLNFEISAVSSPYGFQAFGVTEASDEAEALLMIDRAMDLASVRVGLVLTARTGNELGPLVAVGRVVSVEPLRVVTATRTGIVSRGEDVNESAMGVWAPKARGPIRRAWLLQDSVFVMGRVLGSCRMPQHLLATALIEIDRIVWKTLKIARTEFADIVKLARHSVLTWVTTGGTKGLRQIGDDLQAAYATTSSEKSIHQYLVGLRQFVWACQKDRGDYFALFALNAYANAAGQASGGDAALREMTASLRQSISFPDVMLGAMWTAETGETTASLLDRR